MLQHSLYVGTRLGAGTERKYEGEALHKINCHLWFGAERLHALCTNSVHRTTWLVLQKAN